MSIGCILSSLVIVICCYENECMNKRINGTVMCVSER